jgi:hypothetical protein
MQPSSIGLATALLLTLASLGPAHAGFVARSPHIVPAGRAPMTNHAWQAGRFGMRDSGAFHRERGRQFLSFGGGYAFGAGYQDAPPPSPAVDPAPLGFIGGAPIINVTFIAAAPGAVSAPPRNYVASARPKIILIGARPRSSRFEKLPIVVYGRN